MWHCLCHTSFNAHMRVIEPMLFVMVTSVALAKSSFETESRFSLHIMLPKLEIYKQNIYMYNNHAHTVWLPFI